MSWKDSNGGQGRETTTGRSGYVCDGSGIVHVADTRVVPGMGEGDAFNRFAPLTHMWLIAGLVARQPAEAYLPSQVADVMSHIAFAVACLHAKGCAHRSLTPEHIALTFDDNGHVDKVALLGTATPTQQGPDETQSQTHPRYGAPESFVYPEYSRSQSGSPRQVPEDTYGLGCIANYLLLGDYPTLPVISESLQLSAPAMYNEHLFEMSEREAYYALARVIRACTDDDPSKRPSDLELTHQLSLNLPRFR